MSDEGSVETALAARRDALDPRAALVRQRAVSWSILGLGYGSMGAGFAVSWLTHTLGLPVLLLLLGIALLIWGFGRVDAALADLRRYDARVQPLPRARLRP